MTQLRADRSVLVIGAHGFLGTHIRHRLVAAGWQVTGAGRTSRPDDAGYLRLDLTATTPAVIARTLCELAPDAVVNCAGATGGSLTDLVARNVAGTAALLDGMVSAGSPARLVHLGSAGEYGAARVRRPIREDARPRPVSAYGVTKLAGTQLVGVARAGGLDAVVLRVFNPIGPGSPVGSLPGRLVAEVARARAEDDDVRLGPLDAERDFVDARDVAGAVHAALIAPVLLHPVVNIAGGTAVRARTLVDQLRTISGFTGRVRETAPGSARSAGVTWQQADIGAAAEALDWQPSTPLATSLADLWHSVG